MAFTSNNKDQPFSSFDADDDQNEANRSQLTPDQKREGNTSKHNNKIVKRASQNKRRKSAMPELSGSQNLAAVNSDRGFEIFSADALEEGENASRVENKQK